MFIIQTELQGISLEWRKQWPDELCACWFHCPVAANHGPWSFFIIKPGLDWTAFQTEATFKRRTVFQQVFKERSALHTYSKRICFPLCEQSMHQLHLVHFSHTLSPTLNQEEKLPGYGEAGSLLPKELHVSGVFLQANTKLLKASITVLNNGLVRELSVPGLSWWWLTDKHDFYPKSSCVKWTMTDNEALWWKEGLEQGKGRGTGQGTWGKQGRKCSSGW